VKNNNTIDTSHFILEGQFLRFIWEGSKIKYLRIAVADEELVVRLSKEAIASCKTVLKPDNIIQVCGESKVNIGTGEILFKASQILPKSESNLQLANSVDRCKAKEGKEPCSAVGKKVKLLVCQKSGCQKKGGKKQHQAIASILRDRELDRSIILEESGCLGKCSLAPNVVLMPSKKRLSGMHPEAIVDVLAASIEKFDR
jgi:(2Fe-2S) ferredoxin